MLSLKTLASLSAIGLALAAAPAFADTTVSSNSGAVATVSVVTPISSTPTVSPPPASATTPIASTKTERPLDAKADGRHLGERRHLARHERHERFADRGDHRHHHHPIVVAHDSRPVAHHYHPVVISTAAGGSTVVEPRHQARPTAAPVIHHVSHVPPARVAMAPVSGK